MTRENFEKAKELIFELNILKKDKELIENSVQLYDLSV